VQAGYWPSGDGAGAADTWLIYVTDDGGDPDPELDTPTEVAMATDQRLARFLDWTSGSYDDGDTIKVLVRTRRSGTPDVDSTNTTIYSVEANTDPPSTPTLAVFGGGQEAPGA